MFELSTIESALNSLKIIREITTGFFQNESNTVTTDEVTDIDKRALEVEKTVLSFENYILKLEKKIAEHEKRIDYLLNWDEEKKKYELNEYAPGVVVYAFKDPNEDLINHYLCPDCFNKEKKSIIYKYQPQMAAIGEKWKCGSCSFNFQLESKDPGWSLELHSS